MQVQSKKRFIIVSPFLMAKAQFLLKYQFDRGIRLSAIRVRNCYNRKVLANANDVKVVMEAIEPFKKVKKQVFQKKQLNLKF